ncbi:PqqD family protein [Egibacter rhizosphaerae]|uniref:PqqD family protein n=1 Tax=Egibacter rhizosphaerae TaxID=1670831 RepID=A0A411YGH2_9ACTN|nr:PqqD family protein [Egibacter rhizosphaerae]QBI20267.1 PqqD family protein [Egibacter rhizosphaerae]
MLAQAFDLPHTAVGSSIPEPHAPDAQSLTVVVDDSALTGYRFGKFLAAVKAPRIAFAHLCSHPDLRAAIERAEPRVEACLAARDLTARPTDTEARRILWTERTNAERYWMGDTQPVSFAWKEPDTPIWNPVTERIEPGWRLLPAGLCFSNRRLGPPRVAVQVQPIGPGPVAAAPGVVFSEVHEHLIIADAASGRSIALDGSARAMWEALLTTGDLRRATARVAEQFDASPTIVAGDLAGFAARLADDGYLVGVPAEAFR